MKTIHERLDEAQNELESALAMPSEHPDRESRVRIYEDLAGSIRHDIDLQEAGLSQSQFVDYRNREILDFVASRFLSGYGLLQYVGRGNGHRTIVARTNAGTRHLVVGYSNNRKEFIARGVLKEKRAGHGIGYLMNGQAGRNAKQVAQFDERTCVVPHRRKSPFTSLATARSENNERQPESRSDHERQEPPASATQHEPHRHRPRAARVRTLREHRNRPVPREIDRLGNG
jgi:hypothetical protein